MLSLTSATIIISPRIEIRPKRNLVRTSLWINSSHWFILDGCCFLQLLKLKCFTNIARIMKNLHNTANYLYKKHVFLLISKFRKLIITDIMCYYVLSLLSVQYKYFVKPVICLVCACVHLIPHGIQYQSWCLVSERWIILLPLGLVHCL